VQTSDWPADDDDWGDALFLFSVCEFVLHLARDCIDYIRRFIRCLDVFAAFLDLRIARWSLLLPRLNTDNDPY
jgi:hypothetical protein